MENPYEINLVEFQTDNDFANFMQDEERKSFLHLKEQSKKSVWLIKGTKLWPKMKPVEVFADQKIPARNFLK